jgi:hypothetical protein
MTCRFCDRDTEPDSMLCRHHTAIVKTIESLVCAECGRHVSVDAVLLLDRTPLPNCECGHNTLLTSDRR